MKVIKQNKLYYYFLGYLRFLFLKGNRVIEVQRLKNQLTEEQLKKVEERVAYYCKDMPSQMVLSMDSIVKNLRKPRTPKAYYFDAYQYARFFDENLAFHFVFGDVTHIPNIPSIVKSRPISEENQNSVLINLDKQRHFVWVKDSKPFTEKKNMLLGRGAVYQEHRYRFFDMYFEHPLCDIGQVNKVGGNQKWYKPKMSIEKHLDYKFILSLQGNDVATNLKWIMSSNSIAVMPKPTMETWFMEGKLIGGKHYIEIKPDYSDLEEQLHFYMAHPEQCLEIIRNAHAHCEQFWNKNVEDLCSLMVLEKYFSISK